MNICFIGHTFLEMSPAIRLAKALNQEGVGTQLIAKESPIEEVYLYKPNFIHRMFTRRLRNYALKYFIFNQYPQKKALPWSTILMAENPLEKIDKSINIVHLDWIANNFVDIKKLKSIKVPIVWTLHDVWPLTGGCHCNLNCNKWITGCGVCPQLCSSDIKDISHYSWKTKDKSLNTIKNLTVIAPSKWLTSMAKKSTFFKNAKVVNIPNAVDINLFRNNAKNKAKNFFGIPSNKNVILFGANSFIKATYKGLDLLLEALKIIKNLSEEDYHLLLFGDSKIPHDFSGLNFEITLSGRLDTEKQLVNVYNAADVFVGPSRQDNFPSTFLEASACAIPCVGFDVGGIPEIVEHQKTGYIAKSFDTSDLAKGIIWCTENNQNNELGLSARTKIVNNFSFDIIAKKHKELYRGIIDNHNK